MAILLPLLFFSALSKHNASFLSQPRFWAVVARPVPLVILTEADVQDPVQRFSIPQWPRAHRR